MKILNILKPRADPHGTSFQISVLFNSQPLIIGLSVQYFMHPPYSNYSKTVFPLLIGKLHGIGLWVLKRLRYSPPPAPLFFNDPVIVLKELEWYATILSWKTFVGCFLTLCYFLGACTLVLVSRPRTLLFILVSFHVELSCSTCPPALLPSLQEQGNRASKKQW